MNVFYDLEFLEHTQTKRFCGIPYGQTPPTIEIISIGMVSDDNREYYAISNEFNLRGAWERYDIKPNMDYKPNFGGGSDGHYNPQFIKTYWLRENVLKPIFFELLKRENYTSLEITFHQLKGSKRLKFSYTNLKRLIKKYGKSRKQIAEDIRKIISPENVEHTGTYPNTYPKDLKFYGYMSAFDHVCLAWLFGKMIDLPTGFPMYTIDLKQMLDEKLKNPTRKLPFIIDSANLKSDMTVQEVIAEMKQQGISSFQEDSINITYSDLTLHPDYPKNPGEHNSLSDAKFNKQLYDFLQTL